MTDTHADARWEPQLLEPRSSCSSCIDTLDDLDWVAQTSFHVGEWALGVRSSSLEVDAALREVLHAHVAAVEAPANFSALMTDGATRTFNFLYRASDPLVRTRVPGRILRTLISHLSDFASPAPSARPAVRLNATGLIVDGRAIVAPAALRTEISHIETRLNVAGISVVDAPLLELEPGTGCVIVPEPALTIDGAALARYERAHPGSGRELDPVPAGRYPIMTWALESGEDRVGPVGRAQGVAGAAQQIVNADELGAEQTLDIVAETLAEITIAGIWWREPGELVSQLRALAQSAGA